MDKENEFDKALNKNRDEILENKMDQIVQDNIDLTNKFRNSIKDLQQIKFLVIMIVFLFVVALLKLLGWF